MVLGTNPAYDNIWVLLIYSPEMVLASGRRRETSTLISVFISASTGKVKMGILGVRTKLIWTNSIDIKKDQDKKYFDEKNCTPGHKVCYILRRSFDFFYTLKEF